MAWHLGDHVRNAVTEAKIPQRLFTLEQAGVYIGLSHWRVRSLIYSGQLAYVRLGRRLLVNLKDLDALIDSKKQQECVRV